MPVGATCPNAQCGVVLTLSDELAGKKVRCPKCGATIRVPDLTVAAARPAGEQPGRPATELELPIEREGLTAPVSKAAKACAKCGAVVGPPHKFCPKCGADMRKAVGAGARRRRPGSNVLKPVLVAVICVAALAAIAWVVRGFIVKRGKPAPERVEAGAAEPAVPKEHPGVPKGPQPSEPPDELAAPGLPSLSSELRELRETIAAYTEQLEEVAFARETSTGEDLASRWAHLFVFCRDNGLKIEAQMCWLRAVLLSPEDKETNALLGRTASFRGVPVTEEQGNYLDALGNRIKVVNHHSRLADLRVGLEGGRMQVLPPSRSLDLDIGGRSTVLVLQVGEGEDEGTARLLLDAQQGTHRSITLLSRSLAPVVSVRGLGEISAGLEAWKQYHESPTSLSDEVLARYGWERTDDGWERPIQQDKLLRFGTDAAGRLASVTYGAVTLGRVERGELMLSVRGPVATIQGRLEVPDGGKQEVTPRARPALPMMPEAARPGIARPGAAVREKVILIGTQERPIKLELAGPEMACVRAGRWQSDGEERSFFSGEFEGGKSADFAYVVNEGAGELGQQVLSALNDWLAQKARQARVDRHRRGLQAEVRDLEARGELLGGWQSNVWLQKELQPLAAAEQRRSTWQDKSRLMPLHAERLSEFGIKDRVSYIYLQWPLFREALVMAVGEEAAKIAESEAPVSAPPTGDMRPMGPPTGSMGPTGPPLPGSARPMGPPPPGSARPMGPPAGAMVPMQPRRGVSDGSAESEVSQDMLPLMPDTAAVDYLRRNLHKMEPPQQIAAIRRLRLMRSPSVVEMLGRITGGPSESEVKAEAMAVLGEIGTAGALASCRGPLLDPMVRGAALAALAACGDPDIIAQLPDTLGNALPEVRSAFLSHLLKAESPTALIGLTRALDHYRDDYNRLRIAERLAGIGGDAAAAVLARLMEQDGDLLFLAARPQAVVRGGPGPGGTGQRGTGPQLGRGVAARPKRQRKATEKSVISGVRPADMKFLIEPLGRMLEGESAWRREAALLMAKTRLATAVPALKAAALDKRLSDAAVALAALGSVEALEAAARAKDLMVVADLEIISGYWRKVGTAQKQWAWSPAVDRAAAVSFLQTMLREAKEQDMLIAVAEFLREVGERPDAEGLMMLAAIPVGRPESAVTPAGQRGPVPARPPGPSRPMMPGRMLAEGPSVADREASEKVEAWRERRAEMATTPQMRALRMLEEQLAPAMAPALRKLAEEVASPQIKVGVLKLLGKVAGRESSEFLRAMAAPSSDEYTDTEAMVDHTEVRVGAAVRLAEAEDPELAVVLHELIAGSVPSRTTSFKKAPAAGDYNVAVKLRETIVSEGVREAMTSLPDGQTLWEVSRDEQAAQVLTEKLYSIAEASGQAMGRDDETDRIAADAIVGLGRAGNLPSRSRELVEAFVSLNQDEVPLVVRRALFEALWQIGDATAQGQIDRLLPAAQDQAELVDHWGALCARAAARGSQDDYDNIKDSLHMMGVPAIRKAVAAMSLKQGSQPRGYYEVLASVAGGAGGKPKPVSQEGPSARRTAGSGRRTQRVEWSPDLTKRSVTAKPTAKGTGKGVSEQSTAPGDERPLDIEFRWGCLTLLDGGPDALVSSVLQDQEIGLLDNDVFGPHVALMVKRRSPGFDMAGYLRDRFKTHRDEEARRVIVAVARNLASDAMAEMLARFLLSGQAAGEDDPAVGSVARALGSLGRDGALQKAFTYRISGRTKVFRYPPKVRMAALEGMAYLPPEKDPVGSLRRLDSVVGGYEMKEALDQAILNAFRLQMESAGGGTLGAGHEPEG